MDANVFLWFNIKKEDFNSPEEFDIIEEFDDCYFTPSHNVVPCIGDILEFDTDNLSGAPDYYYEALQGNGITEDRKGFVAMQELYNYFWKVTSRKFASDNTISLVIERDSLIF